MTRVSVLMSVYNNSAYLSAAIDSILQQQFEDFEFIIINDGSQDESEAIIQGYDDARIRYFANQENLGLGRSLNRGIEMASGEYLARMDGDDISLPERLAFQVRFLDEHSEIGVLGTWARLIDQHGTLYGAPVHFPSQYALLRWFLFFMNPLVHPSIMLRRALVEKVGGYNPDMATSQDYDLWWRLSSMTRFATLPEELLYLRKHPENVSSRRTDLQWENSIRLVHHYSSELLGAEVSLDTVRKLLTGTVENQSDVLRVARFIISLYRAFCDRETWLSQAENRLVRKDAARRLVALARSPGPAYNPLVRLYLHVFGYFL